MVRTGIYKIFASGEPLRGFALNMKEFVSNFLWGVKSTNVLELYWGDRGLYVRYHTYDGS
jgi:hypothetical protein